jgi:hypothetical protein
MRRIRKWPTAWAMNSAKSSRRLMPQIERWDNLPERVRQPLIERMRDRAISVSDLNQLRLWVERRPDVPEGDWYADYSCLGRQLFTFAPGERRLR